MILSCLLTGCLYLVRDADGSRRLWWASEGVPCPQMARRALPKRWRRF
jgi:hypothetical protein